jgi:hypothetical protein
MNRISAWEKSDSPDNVATSGYQPPNRWQTPSCFSTNRFGSGFEWGNSTSQITHDTFKYFILLNSLHFTSEDVTSGRRQPLSSHISPGGWRVKKWRFKVPGVCIGRLVETDCLALANRFGDVFWVSGLHFTLNELIILERQLALKGWLWSHVHARHGCWGPLTSLWTLLASTARAWRAPPKNCNLPSRRPSSKGFDWSAY